MDTSTGLSTSGADAWSKDSHASLIPRLLEKLNNVKGALSAWCFGSIGNIFKNLEKAEQEVIRLEEMVFGSDSMADLIHLNKPKVNLSVPSKNVVDYWAQKANIKWVKEGDSNSAFFHSHVKEKRSKLKMKKIKDESGQWVEGTENTAAMGEKYFEEIFTEELEKNGSYFQKMEKKAWNVFRS